MTTYPFALEILGNTKTRMSFPIVALDHTPPPLWVLSLILNKEHEIISNITIILFYVFWPLFLFLKTRDMVLQL